MSILNDSALSNFAIHVIRIVNMPKGIYINIPEGDLKLNGDSVINECYKWNGSKWVSVKLT